MKLSLVVFCVGICLQLSIISAHGEPEIEGLSYERVRGDPFTPDDSRLEGVWQLTDTFQLQVAGGNFKDVSASLFLHNAKEKVWTEVSVESDEEQQKCTPGSGCTKTITLRKPLIGYDLLKSSGCTGDEFKEQPFYYERWGTEMEEKEGTRCYMITVRVEDELVSEMYPSNCVETDEEDEEEDDGKEAPNGKDNALNENDEDIQEAESKQSTPKRNTFGTSITQFKKSKVNSNNDRRFICKVSYTHNGALTSLGSPILGAEVKVYHKTSNRGVWGDYLLDLDWKQFSAGEDKFQSVVSKQHLNQQGVMWGKCFKCEVTVNGAVTRECLGSCTCN